MTVTQVYRCDCCGYEQVFTDGEDAFQAGWDAGPHFTGYVCCNLCPAFYVVTQQTEKHEPIHARWANEGRPSSFSQDTCVPVEDHVSEEKLAALLDFLATLGVDAATLKASVIQDRREQHG